MHPLKKHIFPFRLTAAFVIVTFLMTGIVPPGYAQNVLNLPAPGTAVPLTGQFTPAVIKGINIHPDDPFQFDFIIERGDSNLQGEAFKAESAKLIKYFLASLTVPEKEMWVNLSPYEKDRIIPDTFGTTEMGRDLLAQDYLLKQLSASMMNPEDKLGKKFWGRVYKKAREKFGTTDIPINTFNKIWIVPADSHLYEHDRGAFIVQSRLKVMLEEDYIALEANKDSADHGLGKILPEDLKPVSGVSSDIIREVLIPEIEREVNEGETFANLRQIYHSMLLAAWYKQTLKEGVLGKVYVDQGKTKGVDVDPSINQEIYDQYLAAFKAGVYDFIKEEYDPVSEETIPRKYFSGGMDVRDKAMTVGRTAGLARAVSVKDAAMVSMTLRPAGATAADRAMTAELTAIIEQALASAGVTDIEADAAFVSAVMNVLMLAQDERQQKEQNRVLRDGLDSLLTARGLGKNPKKRFIAQFHDKSASLRAQLSVAQREEIERAVIREFEDELSAAGETDDALQVDFRFSADVTGDDLVRIQNVIKWASSRLPDKAAELKAAAAGVPITIYKGPVRDILAELQKVAPNQLKLADSTDAISLFMAINPGDPVARHIIFKDELFEDENLTGLISALIHEAFGVQILSTKHITERKTRVNQQEHAQVEYDAFMSTVALMERLASDEALRGRTPNLAQKLIGQLREERRILSHWSKNQHVRDRAMLGPAASPEVVEQRLEKLIQEMKQSAVDAGLDPGQVFTGMYLSESVKSFLSGSKTLHEASLGLFSRNLTSGTIMFDSFLDARFVLLVLWTQVRYDLSNKIGGIIGEFLGQLDDGQKQAAVLLYGGIAAEIDSLSKVRGVAPDKSAAEILVQVSDVFLEHRPEMQITVEELERSSDPAMLGLPSEETIQAVQADVIIDDYENQTGLTFVRIMDKLTDPQAKPQDIVGDLDKLLNELRQKDGESLSLLEVEFAAMEGGSYININPTRVFEIFAAEIETIRNFIAGYSEAGQLPTEAAHALRERVYPLLQKMSRELLINLVSQREEYPRAFEAMARRYFFYRGTTRQDVRAKMLRTLRRLGTVMGLSREEQQLLEDTTVVTDLPEPLDATERDIIADETTIVRWQVSNIEPEHDRVAWMLARDSLYKSGIVSQPGVDQIAETLADHLFRTGSFIPLPQLRYPVFVSAEDADEFVPNPYFMLRQILHLINHEVAELLIEKLSDDGGRMSRTESLDRLIQDPGSNITLTLGFLVKNFLYTSSGHIVDEIIGSTVSSSREALAVVGRMFRNMDPIMASTIVDSETFMREFELEVERYRQSGDAAMLGDMHHRRRISDFNQLQQIIAWLNMQLPDDVRAAFSGGSTLAIEFGDTGEQDVVIGPEEDLPERREVLVPYLTAVSLQSQFLYFAHFKTDETGGPSDTVEFLRLDMRMKEYGLEAITQNDLPDEVAGEFKVDRAMAADPLGGIDFNPAIANMNVQKEGKGIKLPDMPLPSPDLQNIEGFIPVIINVTPVTNLNFLIGTAEPGPDREQLSAL